MQIMMSSSPKLHNRSFVTRQMNGSKAWTKWTKRRKSRLLAQSWTRLGERLRKLLERLARICRRETRNRIEVCLEKVVSDTWNENYNAFFYLMDCSHKKVDPIVPSMIEKNALSKTWQSHGISKPLRKIDRICYQATKNFWLPVI